LRLPNFRLGTEIWHDATFHKIEGSKGVNMRKSFSIEETQFETQGNERMTDSPTSFPAKSKDCYLGGVLHGLEVLLTSKETSKS
jgi:hypothetical protein